MNPVQELRQILDDVLDDKDLVSKDVDGDGDKETFCNYATQRVGERLGCNDFAGLVANDMIDFMLASKDWSLVSTAMAITCARVGIWVIAGKKYGGHGHVATVYPMSGRHSGSLGKIVPVVMNVGKPPNGLKKVSACFPVSKGEPQYFAWKTDEKVEPKAG